MPVRPVRQRTPRQAPPATGIQTARGGRQLKLHSTEVFTQRENARPGAWVDFESTRVRRGRYDSGLRQIQVEFVDGTPWVYEEIPPNIWKNFRRSASQGRYINRVLNGFPYRPGPDVWPGRDGENEED